MGFWTELFPFFIVMGMCVGREVTFPAASLLFHPLHPKAMTLPQACCREHSSSTPSLLGREGRISDPAAHPHNLWTLQAQEPFSCNQSVAPYYQAILHVAVAGTEHSLPAQPLFLQSCLHMQHVFFTPITPNLLAASLRDKGLQQGPAGLQPRLRAFLL